jgi:Calcineurin-like phosphoesterase
VLDSYPERVSRSTLIVGDVQGDVDRLREALAGYPEDEVDTVFLGDFFQGGEPGAGGGAAAAQLAMRRHNARAVLGNHDLLLLVMLERSRGGDQLGAWRTRDGLSIEDLWLSRRGDWADLNAVASDAALEAWLRGLPMLIELADGTLAQHTDDDRYAEIGDSVEAVNTAARDWLAAPGGAFAALRYTIGRHGFDDPDRLQRYLDHFGARRVIHGHTPHWDDVPLALHGGLAVGYDGRFSRFWGRAEGEEPGPIGATVAMLPPLPQSLTGGG